MKKLVMLVFYGYIPKIAIEKTRIIGIILLNKEKIIKEGYK